jgi:hypothetical protein
MVGNRIIIAKKVTCPSKDCKREFSIERYGVRNKVVKEKCPFCKTPVNVKFD